MQKFSVCVAVVIIASFFPFSCIYGQSGYTDHNDLSVRLQDLAGEYPELASLETLDQTDGGKEIWLLSIGEGELENRPAIAVVGGISADHPIGTELALLFAEKILKNSEREDVNELLSRSAFYVFPDMNPDARAQFFDPLRYERTGNDYPVESVERDSRLGEDPYTDLNGDGMITLMRIEDPAGDWIPHPEDERVMVRASYEKRETGNYKVLAEGVDKDLYDLFNMHREGMVDFNRNFTFDYPAFTPRAGEHAVSETETRAIADFLFGAKNVFAVVGFGPADNLSEPLAYNERAASGRMVTGILEGDVPVNRLVSNKYNEITGGENGGRISGSEGDFFQWAYFHYGRFSFSTPGWHVPQISSQDERGGEQLSFLRWAEEEDLENVFVPWQQVDHPDYPDRKVEVGGIAPFVMKNPPYRFVEKTAGDHYRFLLELAKMRPVIDITNVKTESLGSDLHRITAEITNTGTFPTVTELGERVRWVQKTVVNFDPENDQELVSGKRIEVLDRIEGKSGYECSWLVRGSGTVNIRAGAESTGFKQIDINL